MRAPFQILVIPYRRTPDGLRYCVLHRADLDQWQFIAGGGEDQETPLEAARREVWEESGARPEEILPLQSIASIPACIFAARHTAAWPRDMYVVPEYAFAFEVKEEIRLSREHTEALWLSYEDARERLHWDSNRTALYELSCRLAKE